MHMDLMPHIEIPNCSECGRYNNPTPNFEYTPTDPTKFRAGMYGETVRRMRECMETMDIIPESETETNCYVEFVELCSDIFLKHCRKYTAELEVNDII